MCVGCGGGDAELFKSRAGLGGRRLGGALNCRSQVVGSPGTEGGPGLEHTDKAQRGEEISLGSHSMG